MDARLHRTCELYLTTRDGERRFESLTCAPDQKAFDLVQARFESGDFVSIEVLEGGQHRFRMGDL